jgi:hypothetical protein
MAVECSGCGMEYKGERYVAAVEKSGWAQKRTQGGTNALIQPKQTGRWLCQHCLERLKARLDPGQRSML